MGYLDVVTGEALTIDLVTVRAYDVNGTALLLPQRVVCDPSAVAGRGSRPGGRPATDELLVAGDGESRRATASLEESDRSVFEEYLHWANEVAQLPDVKLDSYIGKDRKRYTLLPRFKSENVGLVTLWNDHGKPYIACWRGVFDRRAPNSIKKVEQAMGKRIGQGTTVAGLPSGLLDALTAAYREATEGPNAPR